jgi:hypothetical protein
MSGTVTVVSVDANTDRTPVLEVLTGSTARHVPETVEAPFGRQMAKMWPNSAAEVQSAEGPLSLLRRSDSSDVPTADRLVSRDLLLSIDQIDVLLKNLFGDNAFIRLWIDDSGLGRDREFVIEAHYAYAGDSYAELANRHEQFLRGYRTLVPAHVRRDVSLTWVPAR